MPQIVVDRLAGSYFVAERDPGLVGAAKGLIHGRRRRIDALTDVAFSLEAGELLGFIGPNGAGKSTTITILSGILRPDAGRVVVDGLVPYDDRIRHVARIGVVFGQRTQLWWDLPVIDGFDLLRDIYRVDRDAYARARDELVAMLRLEGMNVLTYGGVQASQFPLSIYARWFRVFLTFVVPIGCVAYFPVLAILGKPDPLGAPSWFLFASPLAGFAFLGASFLGWRIGLARYSSTGS